MCNCNQNKLAGADKSVPYYPTIRPALTSKPRVCVASMTDMERGIYLKLFAMVKGKLVKWGSVGQGEFVAADGKTYSIVVTEYSIDVTETTDRQYIPFCSLTVEPGSQIKNDLHALVAEQWQELCDAKMKEFLDKQL